MTSVAVAVAVSSRLTHSGVLELDEGEVFGILRRRGRVSQAGLARETGVRQPRISMWELGQRELTTEERSLLWDALAAAGAGAAGEDEAA